jgi:cystathionine beta-lyase/cystathionine gamma-synthase
MKFETKAIWVGQAADEATGATIVPIYQTSTFTQEEVNKHKGYEYSRVANPTRSALDSCLASLEEGKYGLTFASGLAAEHAVLSLLRPGDHVIVPEDMYGGTYRLIACAGTYAIITHCNHLICTTAIIGYRPGKDIIPF